MSSTTADALFSSPVSAQAFPRAYSRISWGAVIAGTAVALAMLLLLGLVGTAIGLGEVRANAGVGEAAGTVGGAGPAIWVILSTLLSMALGGYVAGRLAGTFSHLDSELHGLTVWALTALLSAILLASLMSAELSIVNQGIASVRRRASRRQQVQTRCRAGAWPGPGLPKLQGHRGLQIVSSSRWTQVAIRPT